MPTLKEYLEEQRKAGEVPYFTNVQPDAWNPLRDDAFVYQEEPFTAESEKLLPGMPIGAPGGDEFSYAKAVPPGERPPAAPTAETVTPGGEIPEEYREKHGLSAEARWAFDQKIPKKKEPVPKKPPAAAGDPKKVFADIDTFSEDSAGKIKARTGIDPRDFNYIEEAEKLTKAKEPELFRAFFGGQKAYHMKDHLNPMEKKGWEEYQQSVAAKDENKLKLDFEGAKKQHAFNLKKFDHQQKEKAKIPDAIKRAISPMYITYEDGKKLGNIPPGVETDAIKFTTDLMNSGMGLGKAVDTTNQALIQRTLREQNTRSAVEDALSGIPDPGRWKSAAEMATAKTAAQSALDAGGTVDEIRSRLIDRGWPEDKVTQILPAEGRAATTVPRETAAAEQYPDPHSVRVAYKAGKFGPPESKEAQDKAKSLVMALHKG